MITDDFSKTIFPIEKHYKTLYSVNILEWNKLGNKKNGNDIEERILIHPFL